VYHWVWVTRWVEIPVRVWVWVNFYTRVWIRVTRRVGFFLAGAVWDRHTRRVCTRCHLEAALTHHASPLGSARHKSWYVAGSGGSRREGLLATTVILTEAVKNGLRRSASIERSALMQTSGALVNKWVVPYKIICVVLYSKLCRIRCTL
jgi:hypothetical protein